MTSVADDAIRQTALDIGTSFAVAAPAGSGKTGLLTRRLLRLLAIADSPEQVLAITFTRKAAAEMQRRIVEALLQAQSETAPEDSWQRQIWQDARAALARDRQQDWQLLANPARLRILTIDGLCRHLARLLALESGLGEPPEPLEFPDPLYRQAVRELLAELERGDSTGDSLAILVRHLDNDLGKLEDLLVSLLEKREQWLELMFGTRDNRAQLERFLASAISETLTRCATTLAANASELAWLADYAAANLEHLGVGEHALYCCRGLTGLPPREATETAMAQWSALTDLLLTADRKGAWRRQINKSSGFPTAKDARQPELAEVAKARWSELLAWCRQQPGLLEQLGDVRHLPPPAFSSDQWRVLEALTQVLPRLAAGLSLLFGEQRCSDFTEITLGALRGLGSEDDPSNLSLKLDSQLRHILVDEFQDTSSIQYRLLHQLLGGWHSGDGRTLFIVGDGMQSLYGFRNANVGLFLEARQQPINQVLLQPLDLQVNFRSDAGVVTWVNRMFASVFPVLADISRGAVPFAPAIAARPASEAQPVTVTVLDRQAAPEQQAECIVDIITGIRRREPRGSIAILARKRSQLEAIIAALNGANLPWQANDIDSLGSRMPVVDLLSLTRALLNPADRIAWLSVLRAPWAGLNLFDLERLATVATPGNVPATDADYPWLPGQLLNPASVAALNPLLSAGGRLILERVAPLLRAAVADRYRKPLRCQVEGLWLALGGPAALTSDSQLTWCRQYFDLLEKHATGGRIEDMKVFEAAVDKLYAAPACVDDNAIQLLTIHKAKGLEFDTVIIPALDQGSRGRDPELLYWRQRLDADGNPQLLISPPAPTGAPGSALVDHIKREDRLKQRLEDARVLYVACTRAVSRLHLLFNAPNGEPGDNSLLARLWPALAPELDSPPEGVAVVRIGGADSSSPAAGVRYRDSEDDSDGELDTGGALRHLLRLAPVWRLPASLGSAATAPLSAVREPQPTASARLPDASDTGRHAGTVMHRTLRQIVAEGLANWDSARIARQQRVWRLQLRQLGVADPNAALATLERALRTMLADSTGRWLLDGEHEASACELALGSYQPTGADTGPRLSIIDRTFIADGCRWIIDYKLAEPAPDASGRQTDLAAFLDGQRRQYGDQLRRYASLFRGAAAGTPMPIRSALYFPLLARLEVLDL